MVKDSRALVLDRLVAVPGFLEIGKEEREFEYRTETAIQEEVNSEDVGYRGEIVVRGIEMTMLAELGSRVGLGQVVEVVWGTERKMWAVLAVGIEPVPGAELVQRVELALGVALAMPVELATQVELVEFAREVQVADHMYCLGHPRQRD
jgi:hypothetical protein